MSRIEIDTESGTVELDSAACLTHDAAIRRTLRSARAPRADDCPEPEAGDRVVNLTFHGVGRPPRALEDGESAYWLSVEEFVPILDAVGGRPDVRLTFDDGNASDADAVLPQLANRGFCARFFVPAAYVGAAGFLEAARLREIAAAGMTVGSHGMWHRSWTGLADAELTDEVVAAKDRLEQVLGDRVDEAACPFGAYDWRVLRTLREAGFRHVFTSDRGASARSAWLQARNTVRRGDSPEDVLRLVDRRVGAIEELARNVRLAVKRWR